MKPIIVTCRTSELRRVRITCRCGNIFIVEIPQKIARALTLHPCPGCNAAFSVSQQEDGKWKVQRVAATVEDMAFREIEDGQGQNGAPSGGEERPSYIGLRIRIVKAEGKEVGGGIVGADPHPEHIGKCGTIVGEEHIQGYPYMTPKIKLDDGTLLSGAECWWEPIAM